MLWMLSPQIGDTWYNARLFRPSRRFHSKLSSRQPSTAAETEAVAAGPPAAVAFNIAVRALFTTDFVVPILLQPSIKAIAAKRLLLDDVLLSRQGIRDVPRNSDSN